MINRTYLLFDIGGTWIKAASAESGLEGDIISETVKAPSPLMANASADDLSRVLLELAEQLKSTTPSAIVVSTAGVVNGAGALGLMVVGTGLGFSVWRNGRRWRTALELQNMSSRELVRTFLTAEQQAGEKLLHCEKKLAECAEHFTGNFWMRFQGFAGNPEKPQLQFAEGGSTPYLPPPCSPTQDLPQKANS